MAGIVWADGPSGFARGETQNPASRAPRGRRRWLALTAAGLLLGAAGFTQGASTAIGIDGVYALASEGMEPIPATRIHHRDRLGGSFWAPVGSVARPPEPHLRSRLWTPASAISARGQVPQPTSQFDAVQDSAPGDHR